MFYLTPPVGTPIRWVSNNDSQRTIDDLMLPYNISLFGSGVESLSAAILAIVKTKNTPKPEVIMPAYSCPELVSAILFAGANPILVDLEPLTTWMNLSELENKISPNTVAIIAVNLFGIPERLAELHDLIKEKNIYLIEDSAQSFYLPRSKNSLLSDIIIFSFGRGKPVTLLKGGAVLYKDTAIGEALNSITAQEINLSFYDILLFRIKITIYNIILSPRLYYFISLLPFLNIGQTIYKPLYHLSRLHFKYINILESNIFDYLKQDQYRQTCMLDMINDISNKDIIDLNLQCNFSNAKLLRYPILLNSLAQRDHLYNKLYKNGIGASKMYKKPLTSLAGLEQILNNQGPFPNAEDISKRLLTIPIHTGLKHSDITKIKSILESLD